MGMTASSWPLCIWSENARKSVSRCITTAKATSSRVNAVEDRFYAFQFIFLLLNKTKTMATCLFLWKLSSSKVGGMYVSHWPLKV